MKRLVVFVSVAALALFVMVAPAMAAPGGMPRAHGVSGHDFGKAVSALATSAPGAVAAHVTGK